MHALSPPPSRALPETVQIRWSPTSSNQSAGVREWCERAFPRLPRDFIPPVAIKNFPTDAPVPELRLIEPCRVRQVHGTAQHQSTPPWVTQCSMVGTTVLLYIPKTREGGRPREGERGGEEEGGEIERERKRERQRGTREIEIQGEVAIPDGGSQRMIK